MKNSRVGRAPKLDRYKLKEAKNFNVKLAFLNKFTDFESLRKERKVPTTYIALEAIGSIFNANKSGLALDDLADAFPETWGGDMITLPASLVACIVAAWEDYRDPEARITMGPAFQIEGQSQGKWSIKRQQAARDKNTRLANEVMIDYLVSGASETPETLEFIIAEVAAKYEISYETVKNAHSKYSRTTLKKLHELGIIDRTNAKLSN